MSDSGLLWGASRLGVSLIVVILIGPVENVVYGRGHVPGTVEGSPVVVISIILTTILFSLPIVILAVTRYFAEDYRQALIAGAFIVGIPVVVFGRMVSPLVTLVGYLIVFGAATRFLFPGWYAEPDDIQLG